MAIYGNRQLSVFFLPVVETRANGFIFKGKQYIWTDVERIEVWEGARFPMRALPTVPMALIWLRDGKTIGIKSVAFEKKGEPLMNGYSSAFDELIALFKANRKERVGVSGGPAETPARY